MPRPLHVVAALIILAACGADAPLTAPNARVPAELHLSAPMQLQSVRFTVTDLGSLGGNETSVDAINNVGQVVGWGSTAAGERHAFLWSRVTGMIDLSVEGLVTANGINDVGQVVGSLGPIPPLRIGVWTADGGTVAVDLPGLFSSYPFTDVPPVPHDINNSGQVVGQYHIFSFPDFANDAFFWSATTGAKDLSFALGGGTVDRATDVNNLGKAVGGVGYGGIQDRAILWPAPEANPNHAIDLGTLGGPWWTSNNVAYGINDASQVVGVAATDPDTYHAFLWTEASGMVDLTPYETGYSEARGINEAGQVVGSRVITGVGDRAFLWSPMTGLVDLPTPDGAQTHAYAINNRGEIVGDVITGGARRAWLWTADFGPATASEAIADLKASVARLVEDGALSRGEAHGLEAKLTAASKLEAQNAIAAANMLRAFVHQVGGLVRTGKLSAPQGKELTDGAEVALGYLQS